MDGLAHGSADPYFELYCDLLSREWLEGYRETLGLKGGGGLFTAALTTWLFVRQRLSGALSVDETWASLTPSQAQTLSPNSARAKRPLSPRSSGLDYGRRALPLSLAIAASERLTEEARRVLGEGSRPTFLLDGTTLSPERSAELAKAFPPARNQRGESHWPIVLVLVAHDLETGLAARPEWGAMYGSENSSEQALAIGMAERLPEGCRIVADRAFGIFAIAWAYRAREVLVSMTRPRAQALAGKGVDLNEDFDIPVVWKPSKSTRENFPHVPPEAELEGRLIARHGFDPRGRPVSIYLYTNDLESSADELAETYAKRWYVETDLRTFKHTLELEILKCRTPEMLGKELVLAVAAYNLTRTFMALAARKAGIEPRKISFARAKAYIRSGIGRILESPEPLQALLELIAAVPLRDRNHREAPPRHVWKRRRAHPSRKQIPS